MNWITTQKWKSVPRLLSMIVAPAEYSALLGEKGEEKSEKGRQRRGQKAHLRVFGEKFWRCSRQHEREGAGAREHEGRARRGSRGFKYPLLLLTPAKQAIS